MQSQLPNLLNTW